MVLQGWKVWGYIRKSSFVFKSIVKTWPFFCSCACSTLDTFSVAQQVLHCGCCCLLCLEGQICLCVCAVGSRDLFVERFWANVVGLTCQRAVLFSEFQLQVKVMRANRNSGGNSQNPQKFRKGDDVQQHFHIRMDMWLVVTTWTVGTDHVVYRGVCSPLFPQRTSL